MKKKVKNRLSANSLSFKLSLLRRDLAETKKDVQGIECQLRAMHMDLMERITEQKTMCNSSFALTAGFDGKITRCIERVEQLDQEIAKIARKNNKP